MCAAICAAAGYLTANHERDVYVTLWGTCGAITGAVVGKNWHVLGAALAGGLAALLAALFLKPPYGGASTGYFLYVGAKTSFPSAR